jgi:lipopolysaccharide heptosyltransferase I
MTSSATSPVYPTRFLVVLMGALGDVVRGLHLVDAIKSHVPSSHITWVVEPACSEIVRMHPQVDEVIVFQRKAGIRGLPNLVREIRKRQYDVTLDLQRHLKSGLFSWLSRAPRRVGFHPQDAKEFNWVFNNEFIAQHGERISKIEHYFLFLEKLGIAKPQALRSGLEGVRLSGDSELRSVLASPYVALVLGSSWDSKDWPEEGYRELIARLLEQYRGAEAVVLLGDKSKFEMGERLVAATSGSAGVVNLAGRTTLRELVGVISGAKAVVGPDSGPAHIAAAVGTPHVTLFGPTPAVRNSPRGSEHLSITSAVGCSPCKRRVCPGLGKVCMRLISPQMVLEKLEVVGSSSGR